MSCSFDQEKEKLDKVKVDKLCAKEAEIKKALICNLNVDNINGQSTKPGTVCTNNFNTDSEPFTRVQNGPSGPIEPVNPGNFNQEIWDAVWQEVLCQGYSPGGIQDRLQCGRLQLDLINDFYGCKVCPPTYLEGCQPFCTPGNSEVQGTFSAGGTVLTVMSSSQPLLRGAATVQLPSRVFLGYLGTQVSGVTGGAGVYNFLPKNPIPAGVQNLEVLGEICGCPTSAGLCPLVPLNVWGIKAYPPTKQVPCNSGTGATGGTVTQVLTSLTFKLNVKNLTLNLATRTVYVMILFGYKDQNGIIQRSIYYIGAAQFGATIDTLIGERFEAKIPLPTNFLRFMAQQSPDPNDSAVVEMVVFAEDGLEIIEGSQVAKDLPSCSLSSILTLFKNKGLKQVPSVGGGATEQSVVVDPNAPLTPEQEAAAFDLGAQSNVEGPDAFVGADVEQRKRDAEAAVQQILLSELAARQAAALRGQ